MLEEDTPQQPDIINDNPKVSDENMQLFVFGNLKIIDKETGEILINKPF